ncbi:11489_t:CDS:2, partial [Gigaspora rosea]
FTERVAISIDTYYVSSNVFQMFLSAALAHDQNLEVIMEQERVENASPLQNNENRFDDADHRDLDHPGQNTPHSDHSCIPVDDLLIYLIVNDD